MLTLESPHFTSLRQAVRDTARPRGWLLPCEAQRGAEPRPWNKQADPMGAEGGDTAFEQALSNLAHTYVADKAPGLMPYEVGFEMIDKNEDGTKAAAVFGFKVSEQLMFIPIFFLNGEMKGHELLYMTDRDAFVPTDEGWINDLLGKKPHKLGRGVMRNSALLGMMQPNLQSFTRPPSTYIKSSADRDRLFAAWSWQALHPVFPGEPAQQQDLPTFLTKAGSATCRTLVTWLRDRPDFAQAYLRFYPDLGSLKQAARACAPEATGIYKTALPLAGAQPVVASPPPAPRIDKVAVFWRGEDPEALGLEPAERERVWQDGFALRDKRADHDASIAYTLSPSASLQGAMEPGIYQVFLKPDRFEKCLVALHPVGRNGREDMATVVRLEGDKEGKEWLNAHPARVLVRHIREAQSPALGKDAYEEWRSGLKDADKLPDGGKGLYMLLGKDGEATVPFRVVRKSGERSWNVFWHDRVEHPYDRPNGWGLLTTSEGQHYDRPNGWGPVFSHKAPHSVRPWYEPSIELTGKEGARLVLSQGTLLVPAGFKLLPVKKAPPATEDDEETSSGVVGSNVLAANPVSPDDCAPPKADRDPPPLLLGTNSDLERFIYSKTASLKVSHLGSEVLLEGDDVPPERLSPTRALVWLVKRAGLREAAARATLRKAASERVLRLRIKYADNYPLPPGSGAYPLQQQGSAGPGFPDPYIGSDPMAGPGVQTQYPQQVDQPVNMPWTNQPSHEPPQPDWRALQTAMTAGQSGQKEVFDTAVIGSLLAASQDDTVIDRHLAPVMSGLNSQGRLLFSYYWHGDKWADRYGKQDMPQLEEMLRNAFKSNGKLALKLRQHSVDTPPELRGSGDIGESTDF